MVLCLRFLKMVGKPIMGGGGRFINGKEGVIFTPPQTMKEIDVFWLHCTA